MSGVRYTFTMWLPTAFHAVQFEVVAVGPFHSSSFAFGSAFLYQSMTVPSASLLLLA